MLGRPPWCVFVRSAWFRIGSCSISRRSPSPMVSFAMPFHHHHHRRHISNIKYWYMISCGKNLSIACFFAGRNPWSLPLVFLSRRLSSSDAPDGQSSLNLKPIIPLSTDKDRKDILNHFDKICWCQTPRSTKATRSLLYYLNQTWSTPSKHATLWRHKSGL